MSAAARRARPAGSRGSPRRGPAWSTPTPSQVADDAAAVLRGGWRWLPFVPTYRVDTRDEGDGTWSVSGGARLPARDRQPRLPPRPRRPAHLRGHRAGAALPRAGDRRAGPRVRQRAGRLRHLRAGHRVLADAASCRSRCALDEFESRFDPDTLQSRDFTAHVTLTEPGRGARRGDHQGQPPARRGRRQGLPAGQRVRARHHRARRLRARSRSPAPRRSCRRTRSTRRAASSRCPTSPATRSRSASSATCCPPCRRARDAYGPAYVSRQPAARRPAARAGRLAGQPRARHRRPAERLRARRGADDAGSWTTTASRSPSSCGPGETVDLPDGLGTLTFNGLPAVRRARPAPRPRPAVRARVRAARVRRARDLAVRAAAPPLAAVSRRAPASDAGRTVVDRGRAGARRRRRPPARARPGARGDARPHG